MHCLPWARGLAAATLLATVAMPVFSAPVMVDFEASGFTVLADGESHTVDGFSFTAVGAGAVIDPSFCDPFTEYCAVGNSSTFLSALNDTQINLGHSSRVFTLGSFSAALVPSPLVDLTGMLARLQLNGVDGQGNAVATSVALAEDGVSGNFLFGLYDASALGNLRSLNFSLCFDDGFGNCGAPVFLNDAQFALDDLSLSVPEPGAAWLVALSLAGLALTRRRLTRSSR